MEMVEKYIYAVTKKLPEKQRSDIGQELRSLIEDMLAAQAKNGTPTDKDVSAVLLELGDPVLLADQYRAKKSYLMGQLVNFSSAVPIHRISLFIKVSYSKT